jgi:hypothetical protein
LVDRPRPPRFKDRRIKFLAREEIQAVLRACPDDYVGAVERPLYLTAAMTGLPQGELERHFQATRWGAEDDFVFARPVTAHVLDASKLPSSVPPVLLRLQLDEVVLAEALSEL